MRIVQMVIILMFCGFYLAILGIMYLPPYMGVGNVSLMGVVMGLSDTTAGIYSGIVQAYIGENLTFRLFCVLGASMITIVYFSREFLF